MYYYYYNDLNFKAVIGHLVHTRLTQGVEIPLIQTGTVRVCLTGEEGDSIWRKFN